MQKSTVAYLADLDRLRAKQAEAEALENKVRPIAAECTRAIEPTSCWGAVRECVAANRPTDECIAVRTTEILRFDFKPR